MNFPKEPLVILCVLSFISIKQVHSSLRPYYIHFPPPGIPVPNALAPVDFYPQPWPPSNSTYSRSLSNGPIPLILHTWVKPDTSERIKLENGTTIYYVSPPWGGIRASSPSLAPPRTTTKVMSNSLSGTNDLSTLSPGENEIERQSLFEAPNRQSGGYVNSAGGIQAANIDITTPPSPNRDGSPWGHGHLGFGSQTATQMGDKFPETTTTTSINPTTRSQIGITSTTTAKNNLKTTTLKTTTEQATTTTTDADPVAASTNARFPVSDSVRKFRRIVAQIRAITKKELGAQKRTPKS